MKRISVWIIAVVIIFFAIIDIYGVEHHLEGFWRVRTFRNHNFSGSDFVAYKERDDFSLTDTRARLYYTAGINEKLKIINSFEMDAVFGSDEGGQYGDIGADGIAVEVKNSYADFTIDPVNVKLGVHSATLARGFLFDADFAGFTITHQRDDLSIPFYWIKVMEGGAGRGKNLGDFDYYAVSPSFNTESLNVNPYIFLGLTGDISRTYPIGGLFSNYDEAHLYFLGGDISVTAGPLSLWATGIIENGTLNAKNEGFDDLDVSAYLFAIGGSTDIQGVDLHGQLFYASGDDDADDNDYNRFFVPEGQSYYWAEIMGYGLFDNGVSSGSPGDLIGDILAFNVGASFKPVPKLKLGADIWYASLAEEDRYGDDYLGTEIDFSLSYELMENMALDAVAAVLFAGDATNPHPNNESGVNPFEMGIQLSVRF